MADQAIFTLMDCSLAAPSGLPLSFLALIAVWAMTSSALRAPPMALLGKYVPAPKLPWVSTLTLLGMGFQAHFGLNSAPLYLRFARPAELDIPMPVFWIGFNLLIFPGGPTNASAALSSWPRA